MNWRITIQPEGVPGLPERQAQRLQFVADATSLAELSDDAEAKRVTVFLQRSQLGIPMRGDRVGYTTDDRPSDLRDDLPFIVPVSWTDALRLNPTDYFAHFTRPYPTKHRYGAYARKQRSIILSADWNLGHLWRGLILLHEGLHAYHHIVLGPNSPKPASRREQLAEHLEYRILAGIGGQPFLTYLDTFATEVAVCEQNGLIFMPSSSQVQAGVVDDLLPPADERWELLLRSLTIGICATYRYRDHASAVPSSGLSSRDTG